MQRAIWHAALIISVFDTMKKLLFATFGLLLCLPILAKKTEDMYVMRPTAQGNLYFISATTFRCSESKDKLEFDITYMDSMDSVSLKITVFHPVILSIDSVQLQYVNGMAVCAQPFMMYREKVKRQWEHRYECVFSYAILKEAFSQTTPPCLTVFAGGKSMAFMPSSAQWKRLRPGFVDIFALIQYNNRSSL